MSEWIDVDDRLPIKSLPVIVSMISGEVYLAEYWGKIRGEVRWHDHTMGYVDVTHWQELPKPPEEKE